MKALHLTGIIVSVGIFLAIVIALTVIILNRKSDPQVSFRHHFRDLKKDHVIAFCEEDISWILNEAKLFERVYIYSKCKNDIPPSIKSLENIRITQLENIGSCDYAYLYHIIHHWDDLGDVITFGKGSNSKKKYRFYHFDPTKKRWTKEFKKVINFKHLDHQFGNHPHLKIPFIKSNYKNMGEWLKTVSRGLEVFKTGQTIVYGGYFTARRKDIKRHGKEIYESMMKQQKYPNEEVDHFIERLWGPIFTTNESRLNLLCVVAIFKNESHIIKEWLHHHQKQGVSHFFLIDNGSTDKYEKELEGFPVTLVKDSKRHAQTELYNKHFLKRVIHLFDWVAVIDLDEFLYGRHGMTVQSYLKSLKHDISSVQIAWKMFGSNGHIGQPSSVIHSFTKRGRIWTDPSFQYVKSIVNTSYLKKFDIHSHKLKNEGETVHLPKTFTEESLEMAPIHLNHYAIQSKNWFINVKMTRGSATTNKNDNIRDLEYFAKYDRNEIIDTELSSLIIK